MPDEFYFMACVARFDTINANRVPICGIARLTAVEVMHRK